MGTPRNNIKGYYHRERNPVKIMGRFTVDAAPAVNADDVNGKGFTVAVTAVGRYTITFADASPRMISGKVSIQCAGAAVDLSPQLGTFTPGAAPTLVVRSMTANAEVDLLVGDYIHFEVTLYSEALDA